ncbi:sigma-70 family RNA polymerase sigma factor [Microlunatus endophyticus]|uniref:sigma-70 family RNA polymerase sigma factor n=1 Tax=Microlunatus endophyticus TaxID=1716077 RepID=UPI0016680BDB|nr:sigma-70 family RNA polymerase sigma factor [Microlunatus endophyticus]
MNASAVASPDSRNESAQREQQTIDLLTTARDSNTSQAEAERCRDQAVQLNLSVADGLARRYRSRGEDLDDLVQVARLGLVHAVNRFEPGSGAFLSFAVPTITGEIKRHFRDHCWTVRPPRRLQELHSEVMAGWSDLAQEQAATPTAKDIADRIGADRADVNEVLHSNAFTSSSLDNPEASSWMAAAIGHRETGFDAVEDAMEHEDLMQQVRHACTVLSDEDRQLLMMRFVDGSSQSVIAEKLGISQMSVSRRLRKITTTLRAQITEGRSATIVGPSSGRVVAAA